MRISSAAIRLSPLPTTAQYRRGGAWRVARSPISPRRSSTASMSEGRSARAARSADRSAAPGAPTASASAAANRKPATTWQ